MSPEEVQTALHRIESEADPNVRALLLAAVVSEAFRAEGFEPVVVGGSAIEFYTDGAYMSGDVDICWTGSRIPTPADQGRIMASLGAPRGGPRSWKWAGHFFDLLGPAEVYAAGEFKIMETPLGSVLMPPVEDLLVERIFAARCWTGPNPAAEDCAKKLLATALRGEIPVDWNEVGRVAALPAYDCADTVATMKQEVQASLAQAPQ
jgi:hypothetical protein